MTAINQSINQSKIVSNYLSIYLSKNEVIRLAADENPVRQRTGKGLAQKPLSLVYPDTKAWRQVVQGLRDLATRDGGSVGFIVRKAVLEYVKRHHPGNNQPTLPNYLGTEPFSEAAKEKLAPKPELHYERMTLVELEEAKKKRLLSDTDKTFIDYFIRKLTNPTVKITLKAEPDKAKIEWPKQKYVPPEEEEVNQPSEEEDVPPADEEVPEEEEEKE